MAKKGTIGAKIVLEGEAQYRQALKNIKSAQAELRSEMKLSQSEFKGNANSMQALASKQNILTRQLEQSSKKVKVYTDAVDETTKKQEEAKRILDELKSSQTASDQEIAKAQKDYDAITNKLESYKTSLNYAQAEENELREELSKTEGYLKEAERSTDGCADSIDEFGKEVKDTGDDVNVFGDVMKANLASTAIIDGIKTLVSGIQSIATAAIETGMEFEASMDKVAALSGATGKDLDALTQKAKDMGAATMYSASEAADALSYMALAGWDNASMLEGLEPILNLAAAADMDLAQASDIVTDYLTAFGLTAKDAAKFSDQLAYAMANSNTNVTQLGDAYKNCAATASSLGYSVEDVTAVLMTMANAGVKGGEAGTGLSSIMTRLATNTKKCGDTLAEYGVNIYDAEGNMNSLSSILEGLEGIWADLTDQEQANLAKAIAGTNQYSKLQTIMKGVSETAQEGGMSFYDYSEALTTCDGSAKQMADTVQDNLKGKITILQSALDALKVTSYEAFDDSLKSGVESATNALTKLNKSLSNGDLSVSLKKISDSLGSFIKKATDTGEKVLPPVITGFAWLVENLDRVTAGVVGVMTSMAVSQTIVPLVTSLVASWKAYSAEVTGATVQQWLLNEAMSANPIGLVATALAGLTAALVTYYAVNQDELYALTETEKKTKELVETSRDLVETYNSNSTARKKAQDEIIAEEDITENLISRLDDLNKVEKLSAEQKAEVQNVVSQLNSNYEGLNLTIDEGTGKVKESTTAIREQTAAMRQQAMYSAVEEDLKQASTELWNLQKKRTEQEEGLAAAIQNTEDAQKKYADACNSTTGAEARGSQSVTNLYNAYNKAVASQKELENSMAATDAAIESANDEINRCTNYMSENASQSSSTAEAQEGLEKAVGDSADAYSELSNEAKAEMETLAEAVSTSVKNSLNAFEKFDAGTKVSKKELIKNLNSQIEGVTKWSENMKTLASRGVSDGLLEELAKLGPEGSNYVQAFVNMTDDELKDYDSKFQDYVTLPATTSQEIAASYGDSAKKAMNEMNSGVEEGGNVVVKSAENVATNVTNVFEVNVTKAKYEKYGKNIGQGLALGLNGDSSAPLAARYLAQRIESAFKNELGIQSPSKVFKQYGGFTVQGYVEGLKKNASRVTKTAKQLGSYAVQGIQEELVGSKLAFASSPLKIDVTHNAGSNNDIIRALNTLGSVVKNSNVTTYNVNGITYDDGSNVANAIGQLIHAAQLERRM